MNGKLLGRDLCGLQMNKWKILYVDSLGNTMYEDENGAAYYEDGTPYELDEDYEDEDD